MLSLSLPNSPPIPVLVITPSTPTHHSFSAAQDDYFSEKLAYPSSPSSPSPSRSPIRPSLRSSRSDPNAPSIPTLAQAHRYGPTHDWANDCKSSSSTPFILGAPPLPRRHSANAATSAAPVDTNLLLPYSYAPHSPAGSGRRRGAGLLMSLSVITLFIFVLVGPAVPLTALGMGSGEGGLSLSSWITGRGSGRMYVPALDADIDAPVASSASSALASIAPFEEDDAEDGSLRVRRQWNSDPVEIINAPYRPSYGPGQGRRAVGTIKREDEPLAHAHAVADWSAEEQFTAEAAALGLGTRAASWAKGVLHIA